MKKLDDSFAENIYKLISKINFEKISIFIKKNIWVTPFIYILGTIILLIRNKILGLQFAPLSIIQFTLIIVYIFLFFLAYSLVEYAILSFFDAIKKFKIIAIFTSLLGIGVYCIFIYLGLYALTGKSSLSFGIVGSCFLFYPIIQILYNFDNVFLLIFNFLLFTLCLFNIPMRLGGLAGTKVTYYCYECNCPKKYIYYGNYEGMYQFIEINNNNKNKVLLIPIDSGYITYEI